MSQLLLRSIAIAALSARAFTAPAAAKDDSKVTVYVYTAIDPSGFVDADSKARDATVLAIAQLLSRSKRIQIVDDREHATIVLEVTRAETLEEHDGVASLSNALNQAAGGLNALRPKADETQKVKHRFAMALPLNHQFPPIYWAATALFGQLKTLERDSSPRQERRREQ